MCFVLLFVCLVVVPSQALFRRWVGVMLIALFLRIYLSFFITLLLENSLQKVRKEKVEKIFQHHLATRDIDIVRRIENQTYCHTYFEYK